MNTIYLKKRGGVGVMQTADVIGKTHRWVQTLWGLKVNKTKVKSQKRSKIELNTNKKNDKRQLIRFKEDNKPFKLLKRFLVTI